MTTNPRPPAGPSTPKPPAGPKTGEALLPVSEVAQLWRCSRDHIYDLIAAGKLPVVDIGHGRSKTRIPESALRDYERRNTRRAPRGRVA
jgi:excisionase family DNA binding protein